VPSRPPFIGRRRDFYIPTIPLNSKNIHSVNIHTNVFYISYIYKPATSSHAVGHTPRVPMQGRMKTDSY
jgi:hypothetical protein